MNRIVTILEKVAGNLLQLIRFPVLEMKYFSNEIAKTGILTPEETLNIYQSRFAEICDNFLKINPRCPVRIRTVYTVKRNEQAIQKKHTGQMSYRLLNSNRTQKSG